MTLSPNRAWILLGVSVLGAYLAAASPAAATLAQKFPWYNTRLSVSERAEALLSRMTTKQKIAQLNTNPIGRIRELGVGAFGWQQECQHGFKIGGRYGDERPYGGKQGGATLYPQTMAWAASFDDELVQKAAGEISDEMRAYFNQAVKNGQDPAVTNCFAPHMHVVRDPRWGRLSETFGEDPLLSANMGRAWVLGFQGGPPNATYIKAGATCKHYVGNDLEEWNGISRYNFIARIDKRDLRDTFLPAFEACAGPHDGNAQSVMCAYNGVNGDQMCANKELLTDVLRGQMGFRGLIVTDCNAIGKTSRPQPGGQNFANHDQKLATKLVIQAGTDLACKEFEWLGPNDLPASVLDRAVRNVLKGRIRMGHFNPPGEMPWADLDLSVIGQPKHRATAREIEAQGIVLLKNKQNALPLNPKSLRKLAVVGPFADAKLYTIAKPYGASSGPVTTPLAAIRAALPGVAVSFNLATAYKYSPQNVQKDAANCQSSDACILFLGVRSNYIKQTRPRLPPADYDPLEEGEQMDRKSLRLAKYQVLLWQGIAATTTKPLIVVLLNGGPLDISDMHASSRVSAILTAWNPGQHGSFSLAKVLFGEASPSGRVPVTWYRESYTKLPMDDMRMRASGSYPGRTYRYWKGEEPLYPFGHGLSYATFKQSAPTINITGTTATVGITVNNTEGMHSDLSVLVFMRYLGPAAKAKGPTPQGAITGSGCTRLQTSTDLVQRLVAYKRTGILAVGSSVQLSFDLQLLAPGNFRSAWAGFGDPKPPCGTYALRFGVGDPDLISVVLA